MAWTTYVIPTATLKGLAGQDLYNRDTNTQDTDRITSDMTDTAKRRVEQKLRIAFARQVERVGGMAAFMLAVEADAECTSDLGEATAAAALHQYYRQKGMARDGYYEMRADDMRETFVEAIAALIANMGQNVALDNELDEAAASNTTLADGDMRLNDPVYTI